MHAADLDDDHDTYACYRHPGEQTALRCLECDRPICVDCATHGAVGIKCPECARVSRAARGIVPLAKLARGVAAGTAAALALGLALSVVQVPYLGIFLAYLAGTAVGTLTRRASGGYRDPVLARSAAAAAGGGMLVWPALSVLAGGAPVAYLFWPVLAALAAAYGAYTRAM